MIILAELDNEGLCVGIKQVNSLIDDGSHVKVGEFDDKYLNMKYEAGEWVKHGILPETLPTTEEVILNKLEYLEQNAIIKDELDLERDLMIMEMAMSLQI